MDTYQQRRAFSDSFLGQVKQLLAQTFIKTAPLKADLEQACDLIVEQSRITVRLRQAKYMEQYKDEFTLRASAKGGHKTELDKVLNDIPALDYLVQGFVDADKILYAVLIDLAKWRLAYRSGGLEYIVKTNRDGSKFAAFKCVSEYTQILIS